MATLSSPRSKSRPRLEIIPFIDIMFFLLATFMMVSLTMVQNEGIDLQLPAAKTSHPTNDPPDRMTISIAEDGGVYLDKVAISKEELSVKMAELKKSAPEIKIILQGDFGCDFGKVVEVFDLARGQGLTKLIIRTRRPAEDAAPAH